MFHVWTWRFTNTFFNNFNHCFGFFRLQKGVKLKLAQFSIFSDILKMLNSLCESHISTSITKSYAVNSMAKLSNRMPSHLLPDIKTMVARYGSSMNLELQQRSVEFSALFVNVSKFDFSISDFFCKISNFLIKFYDNEKIQMYFN